MRLPEGVVSVTAVKYDWKEWYVRVDEESGRVLHYAPLLTQWAAEAMVRVMRERFVYEGRMKR